MGKNCDNLSGMKRTKLDKRFFASTRGRIVSLLRGTTRTVNDLAEQLGLTDNAIRAHLLSLERDGLITQAGLQRGKRKPHYAYELTDEAEDLFPKAYDSLLNRLIRVLKARLTPDTTNEILDDVGRSLAKDQITPNGHAPLEERAAKAVAALNSIGGTARLESDDGKFVIRGATCPLAASVAEHPEVCHVAESLIAEIVGAPVEEQCDRSESPRCRFEIKTG